MMDFSRPLLSVDPAFKAVKEYYDRYGASINIKEKFAADADRFNKFSRVLKTGDGDLLLDFSKNLIDDESFSLLINLAQARQVTKTRDAMFNGEKINLTHDRGVLHVALRNRSNRPIYINGKDVMPDVNRVRAQMKTFSDQVRSGEWKGFTGKSITDIVNIGIGGSDISPRTVTEALKAYGGDQMVHFVSNVDGTHIAETLKRLNPETTLFIIASKSFSTEETYVNATSAKQWLLSYANDPKAVANHFVALSTNTEKAVAFGIDKKNMFDIWDWVNGGYSCWSAIGLALMCSIGADNFEEFLKGGYFMDQHFCTAPLKDNLPVILAVLSVWYTNCFNAETLAILPYDQYLHRLPAYLQQVDMEANGKSVTRDGKKIDFNTGPVVFGEPGTDAQHAFYQLLHQGTRIIPCDFLAPAISLNPIQDGLHHEILLANFLGHNEALVNGKPEEEARAELENSGIGPDKVNLILPHKMYKGNHPSNSILFRKLTPYMLGVLIAMYEHKFLVQGAIFDINSFDTFGVGKGLSDLFKEELKGSEPVSSHDGSTNGLINFIKSHRTPLSKSQNKTLDAQPEQNWNKSFMIAPLL